MASSAFPPSSPRRSFVIPRAVWVGLAGAMVVLGGSLASCGGESTSGSGGGSGGSGGGSGGAGGGSALQSFEPKGCSFSVAGRPEYKGFSQSSPEVGASPNIRRVRLGLGGNVSVGAAGRADPSTSIAFAWQTDDGTLVSEAAWGKDPDPAKWPAENRASGVTWLTPEGTINAGGDERMHEVYVCGLEPATTYYYRVGGGPAGSEVWSEVYSFTTTTNDPAATVKIGISGDSRGQGGNAWRLVQKRMMLAGVNMQVFSGDMVNFATDQGEWEKWLDDAWKDENGDPLTLAQQLTLSAHGNHENHTSLFFGNLTLPQEPAKYPKHGELFYSMDVGPVHLVVVDDGGVRYAADDPEYASLIGAWLDADLGAANQNRAKVPWIVTVQHHPEYSSSNHDDDADVIRVRNFFVPIWDKYHVDLAVRGHDHNYERSKPLTGPAATPTIHTDPKDGTIYVVCAGAGAPAYSNGSNSWTETSYGFNSGGALGVYGFLSASPSKLELEAHALMADASDPVIDTVTITK